MAQIMIKCSLIEITNDNRAVICVGEGEDGEVKMTPPISYIAYDDKLFVIKGDYYDFSEGQL